MCKKCFGKTGILFSSGPNELAKEPHLASHSARVRMRKRPFCKALWAELSFHGKGAEKRETLARSPCQCKDSEFSAPMQMCSEKTGQSARPCRLVWETHLVFYPARLDDTTIP